MRGEVDRMPIKLLGALDFRLPKTKSSLDRMSMTEIIHHQLVSWIIISISIFEEKLKP